MLDEESLRCWAELVGGGEGGAGRGGVVRFFASWSVRGGSRRGRAGEST